MKNIVRVLFIFVALATIFNYFTSFAYVGKVEAHTNQCSQWATMIGKEGRVRDSLTMHYLGCDDGPWTTMHYEPNLAGEGCTRLARAITRSAPAYYVYRPRTVAALVQQSNPWCTVYEDGSYEDNSTH